jgi:hypothetical protein
MIDEIVALANHHLSRVYRRSNARVNLAGVCFRLSLEGLGVRISFDSFKASDILG